MKTPHHSLRFTLPLILPIVFASAFCAPAVAGSYLGPDAVAASRDGKTLFIALADARQLALFDVAANKLARTIPLPAEPTALALSPDGKRLYITCGAVKSTVAVLLTAPQVM